MTGKVVAKSIRKSESPDSITTRVVMEPGYESGRNVRYRTEPIAETPR